MQNHNRAVYSSPLSSRYTSPEMLHIFSEDFKFRTWRELWIALAEAERQLGLNITKTQIDELKRNKEQINYADAEKFERETRHDVMSHVKAYGKQCPKAAGIIHLGATSAYVGDNTDLIQIRDAGRILLQRMADVIRNLSAFAREHAHTPTLGYTHFQAAQPVSVGKRACLWIQDLLFDFADLEQFLTGLPFLGVKGTTGTQASFMELFGGDVRKVRRLDEQITKRMGFAASLPVSGQTYPRKIDSRANAILSGIAQSAHKFASDLRLLQHLKEMEEPFEKNQIGSSAMAYKRNPMRSERICSLARFVMSLSESTAFTAATQWFERTLDDSANKRLAIPEAFLATDAILLIYANVAKGLVVNRPVIERRLAQEIPFSATENVLMEAVKRGGSRQELHEKIRILSMEERAAVVQGHPNRLLERIARDPDFRMTRKEVLALANPRKFIGASGEQTLAFLKDKVNPAIRKYPKGAPADLKV